MTPPAMPIGISQAAHSYSIRLPSGPMHWVSCRLPVVSVHSFVVDEVCRPAADRGICLLGCTERGPAFVGPGCLPVGRLSDVRSPLRSPPRSPRRSVPVPARPLVHSPSPSSWRIQGRLVGLGSRENPLYILSMKRWSPLLSLMCGGFLVFHFSFHPLYT